MRKVRNDRDYDPQANNLNAYNRYRSTQTPRSEERQLRKAIREALRGKGKEQK